MTAIMSNEEVFYVNDPVHGSIELRGKFIRSIIDTPEFQRLRKIKQLGGASYVYPGASHTRFEHSIGVCFIASELMNHLMTHDKLTKEVIEKYGGIDFKKCVTVAALCHDLGHGPYSHLYDIAVSSILTEEEKESSDNVCKDHEYRSVEIFKKISSGVGITNQNEQKIIGNMITFSKKCKCFRDEFLKYKEQCKNSDEMIDAEKDYYRKVKQKLALEETLTEGDTLFLYEIVANGFTEIDVDKMDYFIRDGHGLGLSSFFDWRRYIQTLKVCRVPNCKLSENEEVYRLCSRDKEAPELYQLFHIRNQLYRQAYRHKTTIAVENMLKRAMLCADKSMSYYDSDGIKHTFLTAWKNIEAFQKLNDSFEDVLADLPELQDDIESEVAGSKIVKYSSQRSVEQTTELSKATVIINRIKHRELIKFVDEWKSQQQRLKVTGKRFELQFRGKNIHFDFPDGKLEWKDKKLPLKCNALHIFNESCSLCKIEFKFDGQNSQQKIKLSCTNFELNCNGKFMITHGLGWNEDKKKIECNADDTIVIECSTSSAIDLVFVGDWKSQQEPMKEIQSSEDLKEKCIKKALIECINDWAKEKGAEETFTLNNETAKTILFFETAKFHYGMEERNPIEQHYFYKKTSPNSAIENPTLFHLTKDEVSEMLPKTFFESKLMIYCDIYNELFKGIPVVPNIKDEWHSLRSKMQLALKNVELSHSITD